jgi:hypothetical protein
MITERKLCEVTGYNKNQIRRRRQNHWVEGVHYWRDEAGTIVYNNEEIMGWQEMTRGFMSIKANAGSSGKLKIKEDLSSSTYHGPRLVVRKPQEFESKSSEMNI